jgi:hypothetical protein
MANILSLPDELLAMITMEYVYPVPVTLCLAKDDIMTPASHWAPNALGLCKTSLNDGRLCTIWFASRGDFMFCCLQHSTNHQACV